MSTVLNDVTVSFSKGCNSNNSSSLYAILTQYRRHLFLVSIPNEIMRKYSGNDVESAIFTTTQIVGLDRAIWVRSYWVYFNSPTCPFGTGTAEEVGTDAGAYPNVTAEQPQAVWGPTAGTKQTFTADLTKLFKHIFDLYNPEGDGAPTYGIWQRFGRSGYETGTTTNLGHFAITITMRDGSTFVYTNGEWKRARAYCKSGDEWKQCAAQLYKGDAWQDV